MMFLMYVRTPKILRFAILGWYLASTSHASGVFCQNLTMGSKGVKLWDHARASEGVRHIVSAKSSADRLAEKPRLPLVPLSPPLPGHAVVTVNVSDRRQTVVGFGGALTHSAAQVFAEASTSVRECLLRAYFQEHQYSVGRIPIGTSDFATYHFTHAETPGDTNLSRFDIRHDKPTLIPLVVAALNATHSAGRELKLIASPWTAPAWMKKNNNYRCPRGSCTDCVLSPEMLPVWADYIIKWLDAYASITDIWAITVQNEPLNCANNYEAMHFTQETERDFIRDHLGPRLRARQPRTLLLAYDHNKDVLEHWADTILGDVGGAANFTDGLAFHWYSGAQFRNVKSVHEKFPQALLVATEATEHGDFNFNSTPAWHMGEHYSRDIIGDLNAGTAAWVDWNLWLEVGGVRDGFHFGPSHYDPTPDTGGNNAMLVVDNIRGDVFPQAFYWHMGHFSRFLLPGSTVLGITCGHELELHCAAAQNVDKSTVVVVLNTGFRELDLFIELSVEKLGVQVKVEPRSIHTFVFPPPTLVAKSGGADRGL